MIGVVMKPREQQAIGVVFPPPPLDQHTKEEDLASLGQHHIVARGS
jgi:hypothetical protein